VLLVHTIDMYPNGPTPRCAPPYRFARLLVYALVSCCLVCGGFGGANLALGQPIDWPTLGFTRILTNAFSAPTCIAHAGDGSQRLFVVEQDGRVWIARSNSVMTQPFLEVTNRVLRGAEQGLLGLAFPPGFSTTAHFYVDYTRKPDGATIISRFSLTVSNSDIADPTSEQILKIIPQPFPNHNGGQLAFGPDGYLYIGMGDGGYGANGIGDPNNNAQNPASVLGKLLRIDTESGIAPYAIPASNPFVGNTNYAPEIWAMGLRNPWRFSFDRLAGDLFIGDVGHVRYEEIDFQPANSAGGQNYGWRVLEGPFPYNMPTGFDLSIFTGPVSWYDHTSTLSDDGGSVIGGYVYRGPNEPRMNGVYIFGDFASSQIWGLKRQGTNWQRLEMQSPRAGSPGISTFGEDEQGVLYMADYYQGVIYQIRDTRQVWTPTFSAADGPYKPINSNTVAVSCNTPGALIHYTNNGLDPTEADPSVIPGGRIPVANGSTNKLRAFQAGLTPSGVASAVFTLRVGTPDFIPPAHAAITNGTPVSIFTITSGATIYYTTNGSGPFTYSGPFILSGDVYVTAWGVADGYNTSLTASSHYTPAQTGTPIFTPPSGPITNGTSISISCPTPDAVIFYTVDGTIPTTNSPHYTGPFTINGGTTVSAIATADGYLNSAVQGVVYSLVRTETPVFSPPPGSVAYGTTISITCATPGSIIRYTLDGSAPTNTSPRYSTPLPIQGDVTLSAIGLAQFHLNSFVQSGLYTLPKAAVPVFSPAQGPFTNGASISISCASTGAVLRYTTNGIDPDTNSPIYSAPLPFAGPITLKARAYRPPDLDPSDVASMFYGLLKFENTVVTTVAGGPVAGFSNGFGASARFTSPQGVCIDQLGNLYVADTGNHVIRNISSSGQVATFAGTGTAGTQLGPTTNAQFSVPTGVCLDNAGTLYIADGDHNRVCKIDLTGIVTLLALVRGSDNYLPGLWQLEVDPAGNIYVGSAASVQKILPDGTVVRLAGTAGWGWNVGPGIDASTNIYAATGTAVWKIAPDGTQQVFAGSVGGFSDGPRLLSLFQGPQDAAVDASTNVMVSDLTRIRRIGSDGGVSTLAGTGVTGYRNGRGSVAQFNNATGLCVDTNGNIYVADSGNNCIRKISPDTAGIGIADDWQRAHFGHVGIDPNADPDHDGMSNYAEFWAGTDPLDGNSSLSVDAASLRTGNQIQISWRSVLGQSYVVNYSNDLIIWNALANPIQGNGSVISVTDPIPIAQVPQRFYRVALAGF